MRLCILCEDSKIELARQNSQPIFDQISTEAKPVHPLIQNAKAKLGLTENTGHIKIPLSETGLPPASHWFCFMNTSEETAAKLRAVQEYSIIEESGPKEFLEKWNLQIIKSFQGS